MSLFDLIFPKKAPKDDGFFEALTYAPHYRTWSGKLYESDLVRDAIDAKARHCSKLSIQIEGSAKPKLQTQLRLKPNYFMTWSKFFYRLSTILDMQNTAFIIPVYDENYTKIGIMPVLPVNYELRDVDGVPWIRFSFQHGEYGAQPLSDVGIMTRFQYESDFFGSSNSALTDTMSLIQMQRQGIEEAAKNSGSYRFMAKVNNFSLPKDLKRERERFNETNLKEGGGILLFPNTYSEIRQIDQTAYKVDASEQELIQTNVFNYFGVNEKIIQNSASGDEMDAYFNGAIEPFCIQCSEVLTSMLFSPTEQSHGAKILVTANRLQYMSVTAKISMAQQLGDRGALLIDEIRELFNYAPLPDNSGQHAPIRGEYYMVDEGKDGRDRAQELIGVKKKENPTESEEMEKNDNDTGK